MKKQRFQFSKISIGQRVLLTNLFLILVFAINLGVSFWEIAKSEEEVNYSLGVITPSVEVLTDLRNAVSESRMYTLNWINMPENKKDKQALQRIHNVTYPELRDKVGKLKRKWDNPAAIEAIDSVIIDFGSIMRLQEDIMYRHLRKPSDYQLTEKINVASEVATRNIVPRAESLSNKLSRLIQLKIQEKQEARAKLNASYDKLRGIFVLIGITLILFGSVISYSTFRSISRPVKYIDSLIRKMAQGQIPDIDEEVRIGRDEVGQMTRNVHRLLAGLKATSDFAGAIGQRDYDAHFSPMSDKDVLGMALLQMQEDLKLLDLNEEKRKWATEGIAKFGDILRQNFDDPDRFALALIRNLVQYTGGNQGAVFLWENDPEKGELLRPAACYAWEAEHFLERRYQKGEGLAGQAWQAGEMIYLTDVPQNFAQISSGLGKATPTCFILIPFYDRNEFLGVLELAFFKPLEEHEKEFLARIAENFASALSAVRKNEHNQKLLEESQLITEQMRAQEEEMRQNMEELQATQEVANQQVREAETQMGAIESTFCVVELSTDRKVISANNAFLKIMGYAMNQLTNRHVKEILKPGYEYSNTYLDLWDSAEKGQSFSLDLEFRALDTRPVWLHGVAYPVLGSGRVLQRLVFIAADYTLEKHEIQALREQIEKQVSS